MRYAALISYDGTEFAGWQRQKNAVSVQEVLENALKTAFHKEITVTASGRTDAGVHA
ncbi:MAG TPA: tRNA pseudouridine(38-40) synthase TruA, partial [Clostridiales bacterium]|nr:tRNA pseudouridine(38-40) synthase TruA [Clostridiales bacterium]